MGTKSQTTVARPSQSDFFPPPVLKPELPPACCCSSGNSLTEFQGPLFLSKDKSFLRIFPRFPVWHWYPLFRFASPWVVPPPDLVASNSRFYGGIVKTEGPLSQPCSNHFFSIVNVGAVLLVVFHCDECSRFAHWFVLCLTQDSHNASFLRYFSRKECSCSQFSLGTGPIIFRFKNNNLAVNWV